MAEQLVLLEEYRQPAISPAFEAPVLRDRSFYFAEPGDELKTITSEGRELFVTPVDPETNVPYPILQHEPLTTSNPFYVNAHHARHPGNLYDVPESLLPDEPSPTARLAERNARLQLVKATDHNYADPSSGHLLYHDLFYGTVPIETEAEIFKYVIAACAGELPRYAINPRAQNAQDLIVRMTDSQYALLQTSAKKQPIAQREVMKLPFRARRVYGELPKPTVDEDTFVEQYMQAYEKKHEMSAGFAYRSFFYWHEPVRNFLREYVLKHGLDIKQHVMEEFIQTPNDDDHKLRKQRLGKFMIWQAAREVASGVQPTWSRAHERGTLPPAWPKDSSYFVKFMLFRGPYPSDGILHALDTTLTERLLAA